MANEMERPGVKVSQEFKKITPAILRPGMPACIVGVARQVVEAVQDDASLNPGSMVALPAQFLSPLISSPYELTGAGGQALVLAVNNGVDTSITLPGVNPTLEDVASAISAAGIPGLLADVQASGEQRRLSLRTTGRDDNAVLRVGAGTGVAVLATLGLTVGLTVRGSAGYNNHTKSTLQRGSYPDPRANLEDLDVDYSSVRAFVNPGSGGAYELRRDTSFLTGGTGAVTVADDGDGDNLSPYLDFAGAIFRNTAAVLTGTADLSVTAATLGTGTLILSFDNAAPVTVTFASPANAAAAISQINAGVGSPVASLGTGNVLVLTSSITGSSSSVERTGGTVSDVALGVAAGAFASGRSSRARAQGIADISALTYTTAVQGRTLRMAYNGGQYQTLVFPSSVGNAAAVVAAIEALWGTGTARLGGGNRLVLQVPSAMGAFGGAESVIRIDKTASDSALLLSLGLTGAGAPFATVSAVHGDAFAPMVGDEVWLDGVRAGLITELPASPTNRLRLDSERLLTFTASTWLIVAKGITATAATATRPSPDLSMDSLSGTLVVKHEIFHDTAGRETTAGPLGLYLAYTALRKDVTTAKAVSDFNLLRIGNLDDLETRLAPIDSSNPLALGMYFAMLNAPSIEVTGCGVDEANAATPYGTLDAYARAFEFLESKDVYAIAPMTHDVGVGSIGKLHAEAMSAPVSGLERILFLNPERPTRKSSVLVAGGNNGNVNSAPSDIVSTGLANLQGLLAAAGKPGPTYTIADAVYLEFEGDPAHYLVQSVNGGEVVVNNGPHTTGNFDGFYADNDNAPVFATTIVDRPFAVKIRGALLTNRTEEAIAYSDIPRSFKSRRVIVTAPDKAKATLDGLETVIEGFYLNAGLAGRKSAKPPQQPMTEDALAGFSGVIGAQERYSEPQLRIMCGGGLWVLYQATEDGLVVTRHQLTSDVSSLQTKESSITDALDYAAKLLRTSFSNFIGRFNITTSFQDALSLVADGVRDYLIQNGVFERFEIVAIEQREEEEDALDVVVDVTTLKPANQIRVALRAT